MVYFSMLYLDCSVPTLARLKKNQPHFAGHCCGCRLPFMDFLGYIVTLRGNVIEFPSGSVGVADACSGIKV
ncbi:MAG: archaeosortase/exosortase family protein [Bacilli bacterium]